MKRVFWSFFKSVQPLIILPSLLWGAFSMGTAGLEEGLITFLFWIGIWESIAATWGISLEVRDP